MKSKQGANTNDDPLNGTDAERARWRCRSKLVEMIDDVHWRVGNAPREFAMPRESIQHLLKAAYYLLDVKEVPGEPQDPYFMKSAIRELDKGLGPLGLGVDYWAKINAWRMRDL